MSDTQIATPAVAPMGAWRLINPPGDVTAATTSVVSACSGWKRVYVENSAVVVASPQEGVCHAVQDWTAWGMQRSFTEQVTGFAAGLPAGFLLCLAVIVAWRGVRALAHGIGRFINDRPWQRAMGKIQR